MKSTRKIKLAIVSDNKNNAYRFIRSEMYQQNLALNTAYSHLYFENVATQKLKQSDMEYKQHLTKYKDATEKKYQEYVKVKEKANQSKQDELLQKKVDKAQEAYNKAKEKQKEWTVEISPLMI